MEAGKGFNGQMNIPSISGGVQAPATTGIDWNLFKGGGLKTEETESSFGSFLDAFVNMYKETDMDIQTAQGLQLDMAMGKSDDIVGLTLAMEKASASLNFTVQITNKILEAYKEIMRLQV